MTEKQEVALQPNQELEGINGWLLLVGLGIIISPFLIVYTVYPVYEEIFSTEIWEVLTNPAYEAYNPLWAPIIYAEVAVNGFMLLVWLYVAYLFFTKRRSFPKWYIFIMIFGLVFLLLDAWAYTWVVPDEPMFDPSTLKELTRSLIGTFIWVTYMFVSKRVQVTFVNEPKSKQGEEELRRPVIE